jgi:DNA polymerase
MQSEKLERMRRLAAGRLESLQRSGVTQLPKAARIAKRMSATSVECNETPAAEVTLSPAASPILTAPGTPETKMPKKSGWVSQGAGSLFDVAEPVAAATPGAPTLEVLKEQVAGCTRCNELASTRTQTVFGVGNPQARLCFLGEAPGADEDRLGEPFVGRGGQLLDKIIEACRLKREEVYILNMIKCRPPGNRNPMPDELANCRGYLEAQLQLIQPEFICCLGAVAAQNLLNTTTPIGKLRGKFHSYRGAKVVCTYHPAFLLRSPSFKKEAWDDMKLLMREMGVELG